MNTNPWQQARRTDRMNASVIREMLKLAEQPGVISLSGGLPSPDTFPVEAMRVATERVLREMPRQALQYAASEGYGPLRDWVAEHLNAQGMRVSESQVLITTGSQQGLDLAGKVLIDAGSRIAVEAPTYLGALQAFVPYEPEVVTVACDADGPLPEALAEVAGARFLYVLPNFQNPSGRCMSEGRRAQIALAAEACGLPLLEDNPYGDLWFDQEPPAALASRWAEGTLYLGSFSKVLAPGLRLGYVVAPPTLYAKLVQAKQAADLHTPSFNQRIVHEVIKDGFLRDHVPTIRARYKAQRDAMAAALERHFGTSSGSGVDEKIGSGVGRRVGAAADVARGRRVDGRIACRWTVPQGGMFFWLELPEGIDAAVLLPRAVAHGVAFVPGAAFFADHVKPNTLRLSFVTVAPDLIAQGIDALARALEEFT